jgi:hypothetical protein
MADPKDLKNANNESKNLNSNIENAKETFDELLFSARDFSNEVAKSAKAVFQNTIQASEQAKSFKTLASLSRDFAAEISDIADGTKSISNFNKLLIKQEEAKKKFVVEYRQALAQAGVDSDKISQITSGQVSIYKSLAGQYESLNEDQIQLLFYYDEQLEVLNSQDKVLGDIETRGKQIDQAFGAAGASAETIESVLKKIGASKLTERLGISDAITKSRQFAANLTKGQEGPISMGKNIGNQFKVLGNLAGNVGGNLLKSLGPVALAIGAIVKIAQFFIGAMFEADKNVTALSRNLQISKDEARGIDGYFKSIKGSLETQYNLTKDIYQAQSDLSELTSTSVLYSKETLDAQIQLTKEYGLQAQDAAALNKIFLVNDELATDALDTAAQTTSQFFKQQGILFNERKILEQASKTSGQILVSFKGSTKELLNAVMLSNKFGLNLEQARNMANSLLNFEDSINSEIEAELLTNKNINLERARGLALQGKFAEAATELVKEVGTLEEFQKLNVIQQESLAKAAGLTVDQLSDAFLQQKLISGQQKSQYDRFKAAGQEELARKIALGNYDDKEIEAANKRLDAQEKFNLSMDKVKEVFSDLVDGGALDAISDAAKALADTIASGGSIFSLFGKSDLSKNLEKKSLESAYDVKTQLNEKIKNKEELTASEKERLKKAEERIGEDQVEKQLVKYADYNIRKGYDMGPKYANGGIVPPGFPNDTYRAKLSSNEAVIPLDKFYSKLDELITVIKQGGNVYLDSTKVGTAMAVGTFKTQ